MSPFEIALAMLGAWWLYVLWMIWRGSASVTTDKERDGIIFPDEPR